MNENIRALSGARVIALGVVTQKAVSVILNQFVVLEIVSAEAYGIASIRLELVLSTVLFLSRESFRLAMTRSGRSSAATTFVAWVPAVLGTILAAVVYIFGHNVFTVKEENDAFKLYCIAAALESISEPAHCVALARVEALPRALPEPFALFFRDITRAGLMLTFNCSPLQAFGYSQLSYAFTLGLARFGTWYFLIPKSRQPKTWFPSFRSENKEAKHILHMAIKFAAQSTLKHALTQADKVFLWRYVSKLDAGVYAKVENYGALVCRVILQPIEEAARLALARISTESEAIQLYALFLKGATYLALLFATLAAPYAGLALSLLRGPQGILEDASYSTCDDSSCSERRRITLGIAAYCLLIPGLAMNGIAEAFVHSRGTSRHLSLLSLVHILTAVAFLTLARLSIANSQLDNVPAALIYALSFAYSFRVLGVLAITYSSDLLSFLPPNLVLLTFAFVALIARSSQHYYYYYATPNFALNMFMLHIATAVFSFLLVLTVAVRTDQAYVRRFVPSLLSIRSSPIAKEK